MRRDQYIQQMLTLLKNEKESYYSQLKTYTMKYCKECEDDICLIKTDTLTNI